MLCKYPELQTSHVLWCYFDDFTSKCKLCCYTVCNDNDVWSSLATCIVKWLVSECFYIKLLMILLYCIQKSWVLNRFCNTYNIIVCISRFHIKILIILLYCVQSQWCLIKICNTYNEIFVFVIFQLRIS